MVPLWNLEEEEIFWVDLLNDGTLEGKGERSLPPLLIDDNFPVGQQIGFLNDVSKKAELVFRRRHNQQIVINILC